jgi:hypothetical protein
MGNEECYEVVNNIKVLQPKYIRDPAQRQLLQERIKAFKKER